MWARGRWYSTACMLRDRTARAQGTHTDHHGHVVAGVRLEHVDPNRRVLDVIGQRVPDMRTNHRAVEPDVEQFPRRGIETSQMELQSDGPCP